MSDLSNKYKKAVDSIDISPDFKERTARKMQAALNESGVGGRCKAVRTKGALRAVTAAAAAACIAAAVFALNKGAPDEELIATAPTVSSAATEDIGDTSAAGDTTEAALPAPAETYAALPAEETHDIPAVSGSDAEAAREEMPSPSYYDNAGADDANAPSTDTSAAALITVPETQAVTEAEDLPQANMIEDNDEAIKEAFEDDSIIEIEEAAAVGCTDDSGCEGGIIPPQAFARTFPDDVNIFESLGSQGLCALITPLYARYSEENNTMEEYGTVSLTDSEKALALRDEITAAFAADGTYSSAEQPDGARYIVDFSDDEGNAVRIYVGAAFVSCLSYSEGEAMYITASGENASGINELICGCIDGE